MLMEKMRYYLILITLKTSDKFALAVAWLLLCDFYFRQPLTEIRSNHNKMMILFCLKSI